MARLRSQNGLGQRWLLGDSLVAQWLGLQVSTAGNLGLVFGLGIRIPQAM